MVVLVRMLPEYISRNPHSFHENIGAHLLQKHCFLIFLYSVLICRYCHGLVRPCHVVARKEHLARQNEMDT